LREFAAGNRGTDVDARPGASDHRVRAAGTRGARAATDMDDHEWCYLVGGDRIKLEPRMTFSDEPGIYIRGEFGVRLEDCMQITENGAKLFTGQSASLDHPFEVG
jgi:Xaa-Pro aminopeptidase